MSFQKCIVLLSIFIFCNSIRAQSNNLQSAGYNVGISAVLSGIGALINKKTEQKTSKVLLNAIAKGAIGGYVIFESKRLLSLNPEYNTFNYSWPAKLVNSIGVSMVENASSNSPIHSRYHFNFGFVRLDFRLKDKFKFSPMIMPGALAVTFYVGFNADFDFRRTIRSGEFIFTFSYNSYLYRRQNAVTYLTNITIKEWLSDYIGTTTHEIIHIYQYNDFNSVNPYAYPFLARSSEKSSVWKKMNKWIYWDINSIVFSGLYVLEYSIQQETGSVHFENEANFFSGFSGK